MPALSPDVAVYFARDAYKRNRDTAQETSWDDIQEGVGPDADEQLFGRTGARRILTGWEAFNRDQLSRRWNVGFVQSIGQGELLIGTRGTDKGYDWGTNLDGMPKLEMGPMGCVHAGFLRTFNSYRNSLLGKVMAAGATHPIQNIHCVGHSLGGALATLNAHFLSSYGYNVYLYTFGCPRVYFYTTASRFNRLVPSDRVFRVTHLADYVPPLPAFPYWHIGKEEGFYNIEGRGGIDHHAIDKYRQSMSGQTWAGLKRQLRAEYWEERLVHQIDDQNFFAKVAKWGAYYLAKIVRALVRAVSATLGHLKVAGLKVVDFVDQAAYILYMGIRLQVEKISRWIRRALKAICRLLHVTVEVGVDASRVLIRYLLERFQNTLVPEARRALHEAMGVVV